MDLKKPIKDCLEDPQNKKKLQKKIITAVNLVGLNLMLCMSYAKFISQWKTQMIYRLFAQFCWLLESGRKV